MKLSHEGAVWVIDLGDGENRFTGEFVEEYLALLDEVAAAPALRALVTAATCKFYSNGLDLSWAATDGFIREDRVGLVHEIYARLLSADFVTVAAIQGHAYAAGAMLALAHDARVMREDRGFICLPEVDIAVPFTRGMNALLTAKLIPAVARSMMVFGQRYAGPDAVAAGIVDEVAPEADLLERSVALAASLAGKDPAALGTIKGMLYGPAIAALRDLPLAPSP
jgi:enoyl-CoA hydratase/carnithine racemase